MSLLDALTCGFAKIVAYEVFTTKSLKPHPGEPSSTNSRSYQHQLVTYRSVFGEYIENFDTNYDNFCRNSTKIVERIRNLGKRKTRIATIFFN